MPTQAEYNAEALRALSAQSPAERARQQFANTLVNFGNTATFGGLGRVADLVRGVPQTTTGGQIAAQLEAQSPAAAAVSNIAGSLVPVAALGTAARAGVAAAGGVRAATAAIARSFAPEVVGTRAAALGAKATAPIGRTIAGLTAPILGAGVVSGLAERRAAAGDTVPAVATPVAAPANPVANALAQGRVEAKANPQDQLATAISSILSRPHTLTDLQAVGSLIPAAVKPTGTNRDFIFGSAYSQSKALADAQVAQLQAQAAAGTITNEVRDAEITKALKTHFNQTAALVGFDPSKLALADQVEAPQ